MKYFIFYFFLALSETVFAQKAAGLIIPMAESMQNAEKYCCVLSPAEGFTVYNGAQGNKIGTLMRTKKVKGNDQEAYKIYLFSGKKKTLVSVDDYRVIGYDIFALNYTDSLGGYVKILSPKKSYWLQVAELHKKSFKTISWMKYLVRERENVLGYYANEPGLRIRKLPDAESELIGSVRGDLFEIKLTGEIAGQWAKVQIKKYKEHPCGTELTDEENLENISEGWIKIIDDEGAPNLWSYLKGC